MNGDLGVLLELVQPEGLVELLLGGDAAGIALVVDPLHGELVRRRAGRAKAADRPHLIAQLVHADARGDVRDLDLSVRGQTKKDKPEGKRVRLWHQQIFSYFVLINGNGGGGGRGVVARYRVLISDAAPAVSVIKGVLLSFVRASTGFVFWFGLIRARDMCDVCVCLWKTVSVVCIVGRLDKGFFFILERLIVIRMTNKDYVRLENGQLCFEDIYRRDQQ